jgi:hypothetical protein
MGVPQNGKEFERGGVFPQVIPVDLWKGAMPFSGTAIGMFEVMRPQNAVLLGR